MRRLLRWFLKPNDLNVQALRIGKAQLRWTRIGAAIGAFGVLVTLGFGVMQVTDRHNGSPGETTSTISKLASLVSTVSQLHAGVSIASLEGKLGPPTRLRDLTTEFVVEGGGQVLERTWLLDGNVGWVHALSNTAGTAWFLSVTSCVDEFAPTFRVPWSPTAKIQLRRTRFAAVGTVDDVYVAYQSGADWPGWYLEAVPGGSRAEGFHEAAWGYLHVCGDDDDAPGRIYDELPSSSLLDKFVFGELFGTLKVLREQAPDIDALRREATVNYYGDFTWDAFGPSAAAPHAKHPFVEDSVAQIDDLGFFVGPEYYYAENIMGPVGE